MFYITQLIYVVPGAESDFEAFEQVALPSIERYHGKLLMRVRPERSAFLEGEAEPPYEIHLVSFDEEADFQAFLSDEERKKVLHLKEKSVRSMMMIKGKAL